MVDRPRASGTAVELRSYHSMTHTLNYKAPGQLLAQISITAPTSDGCVDLKQAPA